MEEIEMLELRMNNIISELDGCTNVTKFRILISEYENHYDTAQITIREAVSEPDIIDEWKTKLRKHRSNIKDLKQELRNLQKAELINNSSSSRNNSSDLSSVEGYIEHGTKIMEKSKDSLYRTIKVIGETQEIGVEVNQKLEMQTEKIGAMNDNIDSIDSTLNRSTKILKRMARKMASDRYIWVVILIVLGAIAFIILWPKFKHTSSTDSLTPMSSNSTHIFNKF